MIKYEVEERETQRKKRAKKSEINAEASQKYCIIRHRGNLT